MSLKRRRLDLVAAVAWALLAGIRLASFLEQPSLLQAGHFIFALLIPLLLAIRRPASAEGPRRAFWLAAVVTVLPFGAMRPVGAGQPQVGEVVQILGLVLVVIAVLTLNRSFGMAPAHRGLVMRGVYRIVRHPLYAGELLALAGYCLGYASAWNWVIFAAVMVGQVWRIFAEERLLSADADYQAYQQRVRWRLLPGLW